MDKTKIERIINAKLSALGGSGIPSFSSSVENAYEALTLVYVMNKYKDHYGSIKRITYPTHKSYLNQSPGKFRIEKSFKIDFTSGESFYFSCDVEVYGLEAFEDKIPKGSRFEVDVIVIPQSKAREVIDHFNCYPAPQHIDSAFECKFGKYSKSQLRELLGLKRHLTFIDEVNPVNTPSGIVNNTHPIIAIRMIRPIICSFFDVSTAKYHDLVQILIP